MQLQSFLPLKSLIPPNLPSSSSPNPLTARKYALVKKKKKKANLSSNSQLYINQLRNKLGLAEFDFDVLDSVYPMPDCFKISTITSITSTSHPPPPLSFHSLKPNFTNPDYTFENLRVNNSLGVHLFHNSISLLNFYIHVHVFAL